jgi:outer membrane protein TolC
MRIHLHYRAVCCASRAQADESIANVRPTDRILSSIAEEPLRRLALEVLERNPGRSSRTAAARATAQKAAQAGSLPDPVAAVTAYVESPQTRVGPTQAMFSLSQRFPWFGTLGLRERAAEHETAAAEAQVETTRLELLTETRTLFHELAFLDAFEREAREDRSTLVHYEDVARARYASGVGLEQAAVKIQAEITRSDTRLLDIATRRAAVLAQVNAMRDRPADTPVEITPLPSLPEISLETDDLRQRALRNRPEMTELASRVDRAATMTRLARKAYGPDFSVGVTYSLVGERDDAAGRMAPPPDDGQDVFGVSVGVDLPLWRGKRSAAVNEASERQVGAEDERRGVQTAIERSLGELSQRLPLTWQRLRLLEDVLAIQAAESLRSAESAYGAGTLNALDLLDAERVLLEVRIASARARADYAITVAQLEGTVAEPVPTQ